MANLNKVLLMGNLTRDPDVRYTPSGTAICGLGLAVNRRYTTREGQEQEETCFVDVDVFGRQAESCKNYLQKGAPVLIEGRLRLDQWEDRQTGERRSRLKVTAERVQFIGGPARRDDFSGEGEDDGTARGASGPSSAPADHRRGPSVTGPTSHGGSSDTGDDVQDEIPF
jgi:single-strand DNA-binding protein